MILPSTMVMFSATISEDNTMMKVYAVIGGHDYEGEDFESLKLFDCKSAAEEYKEYLKVEWKYDYVLMRTEDVIMESAISAA
jgi:hypothetical protein